MTKYQPGGTKSFRINSGMPMIRSIEHLADGFRIVSTRGDAVTITSTHLTPAQQQLPLGQLEDVAETFLSNRLPPGMQIDVHLNSAVPLLGKILLANEGQPIPPNWWVIVGSSLL